MYIMYFYHYSDVQRDGEHTYNGNQRYLLCALLYHEETSDMIIKGHQMLGFGFHIAVYVRMWWYYFDSCKNKSND